MDKIKLEDLIPQDSTVKLNGKEYDMRKISLEDEVWLKARYGERVKTLFQGDDLEPIASLAFRLLVDKRDFAAIEEDGFNDDGKPTKRLVTGPERIMRAVYGTSGKADLMWSVFQTFGISRPKPEPGVTPDPKE